MSDEISYDIEQVKESVEGTVVDWDHKTQINPNTGEVYDFNGVRIDSFPDINAMKPGDIITIPAGEYTLPTPEVSE